jgi:hypothetical protein
MMAKAFPKSQFVGYNFHPGSIREATAHAKSHGVAENARFAVGLAKDYDGKEFDLVTCFDCLHDMSDPAGAAAHIRQIPEIRWDLGDCGADSGRQFGAEPESGWTPLLRRFDHDLPANVTVA